MKTIFIFWLKWWRSWTKAMQICKQYRESSKIGLKKPHLSNVFELYCACNDEVTVFVLECFTNVVAVERLLLCLFCSLPVYWIPCFHQNREGGENIMKLLSQL